MNIHVFRSFSDPTEGPEGRQCTTDRIKRIFDEAMLGFNQTKHIHSVTVRMSELASADVRIIADYVCKIKNVEGIVFDRCHLKDDSIDHIIRLLRGSSIKTLWVGQNRFTEAGMARLIYALSETNVTMLHLVRAWIGYLGSVAFEKVLPTSKLTRLRIERCKLCADDMYRIITAAGNSTLLLLDLSYNYIGNCRNAKAIQYLLENNKSLRVLHLLDAGITNRGLGIFAPSIYKARNLLGLNLNSNKGISKAAIVDMLDVIGYHPTLEYISTHGTADCAPFTNWIITNIVQSRLSNWKKAHHMLNMVSARVVKRIGYKSPLSMLPIDLFRLLNKMIGEWIVTHGLNDV